MIPGISWCFVGSGLRADRPPSAPSTEEHTLLKCLGKCEGGALFLHLRAVGTFTTRHFSATPPYLAPLPALMSEFHGWAGLVLHTI